jgi:hypothetical protein
MMAVKNRTLIGGGILVALIGTLLSFMGGLFPGLGGGTGRGDGDGDTTQVRLVGDSESSPPPVGESAADVNDGVLDILIDGKQYLVLRESGGRDAMTLEQIGELAQSLPGNEDGFRVRVSRTDQAVFSAEQNLTAELQAQGIGPEQIRLITEPVE